MKKYINHIKIHGFNCMVQLILLTTVLTLGSCQKYLDIRRDSTQTPVESANDAQLLLNDFLTMNKGYPNDLLASGDDYYLLNNYYLNSRMTDEDRDIHTWKSGAIRADAAPNWQKPYNIVYFANLALESVEKFKSSTDQATADDIRGQAMFFRAFAFWNVAQLYCKHYDAVTAGSDPGIPIRLKSDVNGKSDRSTVQHTYEQIVNDLKEATTLLPAPSASIAPSRPNKAAAYGMLARVYLSMGDYPQALTSADACLNIKKDLLDYNKGTEVDQSAGTNTPFQRFNKEVLFHASIEARPFLTPGSETTQTAGIVPALYNLYDTDDLRKTVLFKQNKSTNLNTGVTDFDGTYRFTGNYEPGSDAIQFNGVAVDEVYLIRAECYARAGNATLAIADLNTLLVTRWKTGTYTNIPIGTAADALNRVLVERRKELVYRSLRWTDIRRLKLAASRDVIITTTAGTAPNIVVTSTVTTYTLPANDIRYTLQIPQQVITNADGAIAQNPR